MRSMRSTTSFEGPEIGPSFELKKLLCYLRLMILELTYISCFRRKLKRTMGKSNDDRDEWRVKCREVLSREIRK